VSLSSSLLCKIDNLDGFLTSSSFSALFSASYSTINQCFTAGKRFGVRNYHATCAHRKTTILTCIVYGFSWLLSAKWLTFWHKQGNRTCEQPDDRVSSSAQPYRKPHTGSGSSVQAQTWAMACAPSPSRLLPRPTRARVSLQKASTRKWGQISYLKQKNNDSWNRLTMRWRIKTV
jgi:hypothetical protein